MLPGKQVISGRVYPAPFQKQYSGTWALNSEIIAAYKKKSNGIWDTVGSHSSIKHRSFNDNPFAAQGTRCLYIICEEVGLMSNIEEVHRHTVDSMRDGLTKIGSLIMLGCVVAGTKVWTNEGKLINIEDLVQNDGIIGYSGSGFSQSNINHLNPPQNKPSYRITTTSNNIIECSDDHPFIYSSRTRRTTGSSLKASYREAKNLKPGDYLLTLDQVPIFGTYDDPNAYLLGLMLGDGYFKGRSVSIDNDSIYDFITSNYETKAHKSFVTKKGNKYHELRINNASDMFKSWNLNETKDLKTLPSNIHTYSKKALSEVLAGLFDSDGNVYTHHKKNTRIVLSNISKTLLEQVKYYLLKFGIHSSLYKEKRKTSSYEGQKDYIYRLYISKDLDIERFMENIPLKHSEKISNLKNYKKGNRNFRTAKITFVHTGEHEDEKHIQNNLSLSGYRYETIKSVEYIGEKPVYNLNVSGNHTYVASNFITGNTGGDMESGTIGAHKMFYDPDRYDILPFEDVWEGTPKIAYFLPAYITLDEYKDENGFTNKEEALNALNKERIKLGGKTGSSEALNKEIIYRPIIPSEIFLSKASTVFPTIEIRRRLTEVITSSIQDESTIVDLHYSPTTKSGVDYKLSTSGIPIDTYPYDGDSREGAVVIYEFPKEIDGNIPSDAYIIGCDPFKDDTQTGASFASIYVVKTSKYSSTIGHNEIVASYVGRPYLGKNQVNEILHKLSLFYGNAKIYFENNVGNVKDYFEKIRRLDLLAVQPTTIFNKKASYNTNQPLIYGYTMSNDKVKWEALQYFRTWLLESRGDGKTNLDLIKDVGLLQELAAFTMKGNFDRVMSCLGWVLGLEETYNKAKIREEQRHVNSLIDQEFLNFIVNNKKIFNAKLSSTTAFLQRESSF